MNIRQILSSELYRQVLEAQEARLPVVFLAGTCEEGNRWRRDLARRFAPQIFFIDPYDKQWEAEDNIYDEAAGLMIADYVIFYRGGEGSQREKKYLDMLGKEYTEFDTLCDLDMFLKQIAQPSRLASKEEPMRSKIAQITTKLDSIANELQKDNPRAALEIDRISDHLEKKALYSPMGWMPGRGLNTGRGRGYGMGWIPGERLPDPAEQQRTWFCPQCGRKIRQFGPQYSRPACPLCKVHMCPC